MRPVTVFLGLGSNQGDRASYLMGAVEGIRQFCSNVQVSSFWDTDPMYDVHQPRFLNAVVRGETSLPPRALLWSCQQLEQQAGRRRTSPKGPRTLDIDILYYGGLIVSDPDLTIPHALLHERPFVQGPLREIAPHRCVHGRYQSAPTNSDLHPPSGVRKAASPSPVQYNNVSNVDTEYAVV